MLLLLLGCFMFICLVMGVSLFLENMLFMLEFLIGGSCVNVFFERVWRNVFGVEWQCWRLLLGGVELIIGMKFLKFVLNEEFDVCILRILFFVFNIYFLFFVIEGYFWDDGFFLFGCCWLLCKVFFNVVCDMFDVCIRLLFC